jgi:hypothetical protein
LESAVAGYRAQGRTEEEAAQAALAQFGPPQVVGTETVTAWRRGERLNWRSFWGAVVSVPLTLLSLMLVMSHLPAGPIPWLDPWFTRYSLEHKGSAEVIGMALAQGMFFTIFIIAGTIVGLLSPKRALLAGCLGLTVFFVGWTGLCGRSGLPVSWDRVGWIVMAIASAWAVSRWRNVRMGQVRLARG